MCEHKIDSSQDEESCNKKCRKEFYNLIIFHIRYLLTTMTNFANFACVCFVVDMASDCTCSATFVTIIWSSDIVHKRCVLNGRRSRAPHSIDWRIFACRTKNLVDVTIYSDWQSIFRHVNETKKCIIINYEHYAICSHVKIAFSDTNQSSGYFSWFWIVWQLTI